MSFVLNIKKFSAVKFACLVSIGVAGRSAGLKRFREGNGPNEPSADRSKTLTMSVSTNVQNYKDICLMLLLVFA